MVLSDSWFNSLEIIAMQPVKNITLGMNLMSLSAPWYASLEIITLHTGGEDRDEPNGP